MHLKTVLLVLVSLVLGAASLVIARAELEPYSRSAVTIEQIHAALGEGAPGPAFSNSARQVALETCANALTSLHHRLQPSAARARVAENCDALAQSVLADNPVHSFAWVNRALAALDRGDDVAFVEFLETSQRTGPTEQGLARLRFEVSELALEQRGAIDLGFIDEDLKVMALSRSGVGAIARRYVGQPRFRERITAIIETLPPEAQIRFLSWVRSAAREAGA